jgi:hypothetical protein
MSQTIICTKWGTRYPSNYVNCLWAMIQRNTARKTRLVCYTDDPSGIDPAVTTFPIPDIPLPPKRMRSTWRKLVFWRPELEGISGDVLFLDLDIVITGSIDEFFDFAPESSFCVIENWTQRTEHIGNTSVFRFRVGAHPYLYPTTQEIAEPILQSYLNEQTYISRTISEMVFWPHPWCVSFKHTLLPPWPLNFVQSAPLPPATKVVCFTGRPNPDDARDGVWPAPWYKRIYKHVRPTPWIGEHWR